jgi:maltooligosyltrehalose trehalohydrolase
MGEEYGETNPFAFFCSFSDSALIEGVREGRKREFAELAFRWEGEIPDATAVTTFEQARLSWQWENDVARSGLRLLYQTLLVARRSWPPLIDREHSDARVVECPLIPDPSPTRGEGRPAASPLLMIERGSQPGLIAVANLTSNPAPLPPDMPGGRQLVLSTAEPRFGGPRQDLQTSDSLSGHELVVWGDAAWK